MADLQSSVDNFKNDISNITSSAKAAKETATSTIESLKATANTLQNDLEKVKNNFKLHDYNSNLLVGHITKGDVTKVRR